MTERIPVAETETGLTPVFPPLPHTLPLRLDTMFQLESIRKDIIRLLDAIKTLQKFQNQLSKSPANLITEAGLKTLLLFSSAEKEVLDELLSSNIAQRLKAIEDSLDKTPP